MGIHLEDSLYAATYDAFKANLYNKVVHNRAISDKRYPEGANRDKFLFIGGLTQLHEGNIQACLDDMQQMVEKYPNSRLSEMAGMILNGVKAGRQLKGGTFDLSNVWSRRNAVLNDDAKVVHNRAISDKRYPEGANRDKFLFIGGLTQLHEGNIQACLDDMQQMVEKYPNSRLSEMAGMILNGVKAGRQLKGGTFDLLSRPAESELSGEPMDRPAHLSLL